MQPVMTRADGTVLYARRTEANGLAFYTDDIGGGAMVVDMTTTRPSDLQWIIENHERLNNVIPEIDLPPLEIDESFA